MNGGGRIEREYGLGRGRTDLLIVWPRGAGGSAAGGSVARGSVAAESGARGSRAGGGKVARVDRIVIECKVRHASLERTIADGLEQTAAYVDRCSAAEGHLVIVDRAEGRRWDEKVFHRAMTSSAGAAIDVWGM